MDRGNHPPPTWQSSGRTRFRCRLQVETRVCQMRDQQAARSGLGNSGLSGAVYKGIHFPYTAEKYTLIQNNLGRKYSISVKVLGYWVVLELVAAGTYRAFTTSSSKCASAHAGAGGRQASQRQGWLPAAASPCPGRWLHPVVARGRCWLKQGRAAHWAELAPGQPPLFSHVVCRSR